MSNKNAGKSITDGDDGYFEPTVINGCLRCCARKRKCRCGYKFKEPDRTCPECGRDRRCLFRTTLKNGGNGRCSEHGKNFGKGFSNPATKHGKYSSHLNRISELLPKAYRESFLAIRGSPHLLDNADAIAVLYTRWEEQLAGLSGGGESKGLVERLNELWAELQAANRAAMQAREDGDSEAMAEAQKRTAETMSALGKTITGAASKIQAWEDWKETTREISALRLDQAKLKDFSARWMSIEWAMRFAMWVRDAVLEVLDREQHKQELGAIVNKLDELYTAELPKAGGAEHRGSPGGRTIEENG